MIRIKNEKQIDGIRKSCKLLARLFKEIVPMTVAGVSTKELDDFAKDFMHKHGGSPAWYKENFPSAICCSINDEVIHGIPSKKRIIRDGDLVSLDIGIDLGGYISDSTVTVPVGNVDSACLKMLEAAKESLAAGIDACRVGNRISHISNAVYDVLAPKGYGVVYSFCGHGVGLKVHEDPSIPNVPDGGSNHRIVPGMVLAIEPMVNLGTPDVEILEDGWTVVTADGKPSVHVEHTVAVFKDHTEILTVLDPDEE